MALTIFTNNTFFRAARAPLFLACVAGGADCTGAPYIIWWTYLSMNCRLGISVIFKRVERVHGARPVVHFLGRRGVGSWKRKELEVGS